LGMPGKDGFEQVVKGLAEKLCHVTIEQGAALRKYLEKEIRYETCSSRSDWIWSCWSGVC
jgi:hypothetical protein